MKRALATLLSVVFIAVLLISCSSGGSGTTPPESKPAEGTSEAPATSGEAPATAAPASDGILRTNGGPADKFSAAWADYGGFAKTNLFRRLLMLDENLQPVHKDLATDYKVSEDGLVYTFTLRDDVKWHDGTAFSGEDVKWSLTAALKSASINAVFSGAFSKIEGAQAVKDGTATELSGVTVDGSTLTIKLTEPVGVFLTAMAQWPPYPKHLLEKEDPATLHLASFWEKPIGNGPYMLTEVVPNNFAMLEPFPEYYGKKPKIQKIMLQTMAEDQIVPKAQAEELDYISVMDLNQVNEILKNPNYSAESVDIIYIRYLMANMMGPKGAGGNPKIADLRVRQALLHAIDREAIASQLYPNQANVLDTKIPKGLPEYYKNAVTYPYDPEKAKQLLQEAGYDFNQPIKLALYYADQTSADLIDTIKFYWEEAGLKVETTLLQGNLLELIYETRDYDFIYAGLSAMALEEVYGLFHSDSPLGTGVMGAYPDKWDPIINELRRESDPEKRKEIVGRLQQMEAEFLTHMPLFSMSQYILTNNVHLSTAGVYGNEWTNYDRKLETWEMK